MVDEEVRDLLGGDPHHVIVQTLLGHPKHLASTDEIEHIAGDGVETALADLMDAGIVEAYHQPSNDEEGLPTEFYGFSERGVEVISKCNFLKGIPWARAVYVKTQKPEYIRRHEDAPRPDHPEHMERLRGVRSSDLTGYERVRWDQTLWICPECGGRLEPLGDPDLHEQRLEEDWWEGPREWADVPAVACYDCERRIRAWFKAIDGDDEGDG